MLMKEKIYRIEFIIFLVKNNFYKEIVFKIYVWSLYMKNFYILMKIYYVNHWRGLRMAKTEYNYRYKSVNKISFNTFLHKNNSYFLLNCLPLSSLSCLSGPYKLKKSGLKPEYRGPHSIWVIARI